MQPVCVDLNSDLAVLRAECGRLGVKAPKTATIKTLRKNLRTYQSTYNFWRRYADLAERLFGTNHNIDTRTVPDIEAGMADLLFQRLMQEGYVHVGGVDGGGLYDPPTGDTIYVLNRTNPYHAHVKRIHEGHETTNNLCAIVYAARLAFPDVNETYLAWEAEPKPRRKRTKRSAG
jgi:hypothetical protein